MKLQGGAPKKFFILSLEPSQGSFPTAHFSTHHCMQNKYFFPKEFVWSTNVLSYGLGTPGLKLLLVTTWLASRMLCKIGVKTQSGF